ncbi:hypothetical protein B4Q04_00740 [Zobellia sp. OII3]|nr:hypothetical protein B4Q04_00740 [Zobellia sp. OII3]
MFPDIYLKSKNVENIIWTPISLDESQQLDASNGIWSSLRSFDTMNRYANRLKVDSVVALDFHFIKYAAIFRRFSYELTSILFLQFYRLKRESLKQKVEFYKRYYVTKWCVGNPKVRKVFVLNDHETVDYMNKEFRTNCFHMLPDPIPQLRPLPNFDIYEHYKIDPHRKIYLHIGALGARKGTDEVINSAHCVDVAEQKDIAILLVGKASNENDMAVYKGRIQEVKDKTDVQIIWDNQFVPSKMMKSLFDQCHAVLLPYKNAEFSSGILGHAAASQKMVLATNAGLLRELVLKYKLGELLDVPDAKHIALKMVEMIGKKAEVVGQHQFVKNHSPKMFAEKVLGI